MIRAVDYGLNIDMTASKILVVYYSRTGATRRLAEPLTKAFRLFLKQWIGVLARPSPKIRSSAVGDKTGGLTHNFDGSLDDLVQLEPPARGATGVWLRFPTGVSVW